MIKIYSIILGYCFLFYSLAYGENTLSSVGNSLKNVSLSEKHEIKTGAFLKLITPIKYTYNKIDITIERLYSKGSLLVVECSAKKDNIDITLNGPFLYRNPPILIPDGTYSTTTIIGEDGKENEIQIANFKEDIEGSLKEFVGQTVESQLK